MQVHRVLAAAFGGLIVSAQGLAETNTFTFSPQADPHNFLMFQVAHQGYSNVIGFFKTYEGVLELDEENLENSSVEVTIELGSLDLAGNATWNEHATNALFKLPEFPQMTYQSVSVEDLGGGRMTINGELTLLGVTRPVVLEATLNRVADNRRGGGRKAGVSATGMVDRSQFGITALPPIGTELPIQIEIEALSVEK